MRVLKSPFSVDNLETTGYTRRHVGKGSVPSCSSKRHFHPLSGVIPKPDVLLGDPGTQVQGARNATQTTWILNELTGRKSVGEANRDIARGAGYVQGGSARRLL